MVTDLKHGKQLAAAVQQYGLIWPRKAQPRSDRLEGGAPVSRGSQKGRCCETHCERKGPLHHHLLFAKIAHCEFRRVGHMIESTVATDINFLY